MSKKQLLTESEMRRFARLANIPVLGKSLVNESEQVEEEQVEEAAMPAMEAEDAPALPTADDISMDDEGGDMGGDEVDPKLKDMLAQFIQSGAEAVGLNVSVEDDGGEEEMDMDMEAPPAGEDEGGDEGEEDEDEGGEDEEMEEGWDKKEESQQLSEDELVEAVLSRVTARLMAEAKKKKMSVKAKMEEKKKKKPANKGKEVLTGGEEEEAKKMEEATDAKGGGPLLSKGGNKHDTYKGHADMQMGKGEKGGKGGHEMETVSAKAEHTVTHGGKNLATLGGNKTK